MSFETHLVFKNTGFKNLLGCLLMCLCTGDVTVHLRGLHAEN